MRELTMNEVDCVAGGLNPPESVAAIIALAAFVPTLAVVGVAAGAVLAIAWITSG